MPGKKKKGNKGGAQRPPLNGPNDSLKADIAAARSPSDPYEDEDGDDIAAQLLASLDARDEAEAEAVAAKKDPTTPSSTGRHRSSSGVLAGLKEAGEKILHPHKSPRDGGGSDASPQGQAGSPTSISPLPPAAATPSSPEPQKKMGRQKLRKQRKEAEAAADRARYEEELRANGGNVDEAEVERQGITLACQSLQVEMHEINPDGHCLYAAIADQYNLHYNHKTNYAGMRRTTSEHMKSHRDDFLPFISDGDEKMAGISNPNAGDEDHFMRYCDAIETTGVWGGQPEILALSQALNVPIWVIQSGSPPVKIGEENKGKPLLISYHRKMYGLGEHYNSLWPVGFKGN